MEHCDQKDGESMEWVIVGAIFGILIVISFFIGWVIGVQMTSKKAAEIVVRETKKKMMMQE